ncbi:TPA: rhodanese-like domain-containing protein [Streptococcus suis]
MSIKDWIKDLTMPLATIAAKDLYRRYAEGPVLILDVRSPREFNRAHIKGTTNLPFEQVDKYTRSHDQPIYVICQSGHRSWHATKTLTKAGYQAVYVKGGLDQWPGDLVRG